MVNRVDTGVSKRVTLIIATIAAFATPLMMSGLNVALPTIGEEFAMEAVLLGWVANAMTLATAAMLLPAGRLADIYGRKKIFSYGILIFAVTSFLCAISNSAISLILYRILQGLGGGMIYGTSVAILTSVFPAGERGRVLGINIAAVYLGLSLGPFLGGVLTQHLGWRSLFFLGALLTLVVAVLVFWKLKGEWADARGERFDVVGSIAFGVSLVVAIYGFTVLPATLGIILVVLGVLGMLAFVRWEAKVESPVFNVGLFRRNIVFVFSNLATLANYSAIWGVTFLMSLYLQYTKGLSPQAAGSILVVQPAIMTIVAPIAGRLSDRVEPQIVASIGMAFSCTALLLFTFFTGETTLGFIIGSLVIFGLGVGFFSSPNTNAVMGSVEKRFLGVASGAQATMRSVGMAFSMGIVMILFSLYIGKAQITPEYYPAFLTSMKVGFMVFAAICFGGIFAQLAGRKARRGGNTE
jgi:EmrB/QacA subfamily drug resistance transporter